VVNVTPTASVVNGALRDTRLFTFEPSAASVKSPVDALVNGLEAELLQTFAVPEGQLVPDAK
jgi:hypothetical protein